MLQVSQLSGFGGGLGIPTLIQKGYGHVYDTGETADLSMSYANVDGGSAPAAGDLVVWVVMAADNVAMPIVDLTGSGWTQIRATDALTSILHGSILAKVVATGDLSSPPLVVDDPTAGSIALWAAYTVNGSIAALNAPTLNIARSGTGTPVNQSVDSSALASPNVAIMIGAGGGDDGSPTLSKTGASADINFASSANLWLGGVAETRFLINAIVGGESVTYSKSDDGGENHMMSGYVSVTFN